MMVTSHGNCCYHDFYQVFVSDETTEVISTSQTTDKQKGANLLRRTEERRVTKQSLAHGIVLSKKAQNGVKPQRFFLIFLTYSKDPSVTL